MKKRILGLLMAMTLVVGTLVGCNSAADTNKDATNDTEVVVSTENTVDTEVVENSEVVESTEVMENTEVSSEDEWYSYVSTWVFPEEMEGFTDKWIFADDENWSYNQTHYVDVNGNTMNFKWEGPTGLGQVAYTGVDTEGNPERTLFMKDSSGELTLEDFEETKSFDKETIISFAAGSDTPYIEDGYYNANIGNTFLSFTFAVSGDVQGKTYKGYDHYIMDIENNACYQFTYLEDISIYDDQRALSVVNSLEYWDYIPEE